MAEKEQAQAPSFEQRLPVVLVTLSVLLLLAFIPGRIRLFPHWVVYLIGSAMLLPMIIVGAAPNKALWLRVEHAVTLFFCFLGGVGIVASLAMLIRAMLNRSAEVSGLQLLSSSVSIWVTNMLVFTLVYWQIDRGGPQARMSNKPARPDWHFPTQDFSETPQGWRPTFADYLFLGFTTATSFGPAETFPVTARAQLLVMLESSISLVTTVTVAARAINILG